MKRLICLLCLAGIITASPAQAATFTIENADPPNEGFNDPNPPPNNNQIGNNPGATLGELRLNVFQAAADRWGEFLQSDVTIIVRATFGAFAGCNPLGQAGPAFSHSDFPEAPLPNTRYAIALANALAGSDREPGNHDINAEFNAKLDDGSCFAPGGWYYGLDDNVPQGAAALFPVVLHELGHGLGFSSEIMQSGAFLNAIPSAFSRNIFDLETGEKFTDMTDLERQVASLNDPHLVWDGPEVTKDRHLWLDPAPELEINLPPEISGVFEAVRGEEPGSVIPQSGITGGVIEGTTLVPGNICETFPAGIDFEQNIVLFDVPPPQSQGGCSVIFPALFAQRRNAAAVLFANTVDEGFPDVSGQFLPPSVNIPYIGVEKAVADDLRSVDLSTTDATIRNSPDRFIGENQGQVRLYAPGQYEPGSSVSHFTSDATPDLLMEPRLGTQAFDQIDLTVPAFQDIGWPTMGGNVPPVAVNNYYQMVENTVGDPTSLMIPAPGVLGNDSDSDGPQALSATLQKDVSNGDLVLNPNGSFEYTPNQGFVGVDFFTYVASDGEDDSNIARVEIDVKSVGFIFGDGFENGHQP